MKKKKDWKEIKPPVTERWKTRITVKKKVIKERKPALGKEDDH
jgi:hypothetical protein